MNNMGDEFTTETIRGTVEDQRRKDLEEWCRLCVEAGFDVTTVNATDDCLDVGCSQCQVAVIQGVSCHEHGCPNLRRTQAKVVAELAGEM